MKKEYFYWIFIVVMLALLGVILKEERGISFGTILGIILAILLRYFWIKQEYKKNGHKQQEIGGGKKQYFFGMLCIAFMLFMFGGALVLNTKALNEAFTTDKRVQATFVQFGKETPLTKPFQDALFTYTEDDGQIWSLRVKGVGMIKDTIQLEAGKKYTVGIYEFSGRGVEGYLIEGVEKKDYSYMVALNIGFIVFFFCIGILNTYLYIRALRKKSVPQA